MFNRLEKLGCGAINSEENVWLIGYLEAKSPSFQGIVQLSSNECLLFSRRTIHHASESIFNEVYRAQRKRLAS